MYSPIMEHGTAWFKPVFWLPWEDSEWLFNYINLHVLPFPGNEWRLKKALSFSAKHGVSNKKFWDMKKGDGYELGYRRIPKEDIEEWYWCLLMLPEELR